MAEENVCTGSVFCIIRLSMRDIIIKAFGYVAPVPQECLEELQALGRAWYLDESVFALEDGGLHIYYEGEYFPHEETAAVLAKYLVGQSEGKLDIIDYEAWTLRRYFMQMEYQRAADLEKGILYSRSSSLDHALEASMQKNSSVVMK